MRAITIVSTKNGYVVYETDNIAPTLPDKTHVFANLADLNYWIGLKLDVPPGE